MSKNPLLAVNQILDEMTQNITREMNKQLRTSLKSLPIEVIDVEPMIGKIHVGEKNTTFSLALIFFLRVKENEGGK